jgi:hypothetical protein
LCGSGRSSAIAVPADIYTHVLMDYREIDRVKLLERVRAVHSRVHTSGSEIGSYAGTF